jgi:type II secretory pathway pseudopilin PulG
MGAPASCGKPVCERTGFFAFGGSSAPILAEMAAARADPQIDTARSEKSGVWDDFLTDHSRLPGYGQGMLYPFSRLCAPARLRLNCAAAAQKKNGFNLIEAVIVLGVVGLVIGGIWVAASALSTRVMITRGASANLTIAQEVRRLFPYDSYPTGINQNVDVTSTVIAANLAPSDMISGTHIMHNIGKDPQNISLPEILVYQKTDATGVPYLDIKFKGMGNAKLCTELLNNIVLKARDNKDMYFWMACSFSACDQGWLPTTTLHRCPDDGGRASLDLYFKP